MMVITMSPFTTLLTQTFAKYARYYTFSLIGENWKHKV